MIEFTGRYWGKSTHFFISIDKPEEWAFLQPYFLVTSMDHPRKGKIMRMDCLISGKVWEGTQKHGYGYAWSEDVYGTLIDIILNLYGKTLSENAKGELNRINTSNSQLLLSDETLEELEKLNEEYFYNKYIA